MTFSKIFLLSLTSCLGIYLFVSAPEPMPDATKIDQTARSIEVANMFNAVNAINASARQIYTSRIVGGGKKAGLAFGEDWAEPDVAKGPLPALFLRLVAARMETKPPQLGLYLGSDEPINKSNLFSGVQARAFDIVKETQAQVFLEDAQVGYVAMYPDLASAQPCVSCHNEHIDSPKTDWKMGEVMGATTWIYPAAMVSAPDYLDVTEAFYDAVAESYQIYLDKVAGFDPSIPIADEWPSEDNLTLPSLEVFMAEVRKASAETVLNDLVLDATAKFETLEITQ